MAHSVHQISEQRVSAECRHLSYTYNIIYMCHCYYYIMIFTLVRLRALCAYNTRVYIRRRSSGPGKSFKSPRQVVCAVLSSPRCGVVSFTPARQHRGGDVCNKRLMRIYTLCRAAGPARWQTSLPKTSGHYLYLYNYIGTRANRQLIRYHFFFRPVSPKTTCGQ